MGKLFKITLSIVSGIGLAIIAIATWMTVTLPSAGPAVAAAEPQKPSFSMRGLSAATSLETAKAGGVVESCYAGGGTVTTCYLKDTKVGGAEAGSTYVSFDKGHFDNLSVQFHQSRFASVSDALTSAYGKTCRFNVEQLQNAFGATFQSMKATWCFADGEMTFVERSRDDFRLSELTYAPHGEPERPASFKPSDI